LPYGRYLLVVLLVPLLALLSAFLLARTDLYLRINPSLLWHGMAEHMDDMAGQNCDVVIYGDSTGMLGLIPSVIQRQTGWKTCNLALAYMAVSATGDLTLRHYLSENRPPKFIVFAIQVAHMRAPALDEDGGAVDAWWFADRYLPPMAAMALFLRHPDFSFLFAARFWQSFTNSAPGYALDYSQRTYRSDLALVRAENGFAPFLIRKSLAEICHPAFIVDAPDPAYLRSLHRYERNGTRVLVYLAPVPDCETRAAQFAALARSAGLQPPAVLPAQDFGDPRHLRPEAAVLNSEILARELLALNRQTPAGAGKR
jgi:hypothetical protein